MLDLPQSRSLGKPPTFSISSASSSPSQHLRIQAFGLERDSLITCAGSEVPGKARDVRITDQLRQMQLSLHFSLQQNSSDRKRSPLKIACTCRSLLGRASRLVYVVACSDGLHALAMSVWLWTMRFRRPVFLIPSPGGVREPKGACGGKGGLGSEGRPDSPLTAPAETIESPVLRAISGVVALRIPRLLCWVMSTCWPKSTWRAPPSRQLGRLSRWFFIGKVMPRSHLQ